MTVVQLQDCRVVDGYVVPTNVHMQRLSYETIAFFFSSAEVFNFVNDNVKISK